MKELSDGSLVTLLEGDVYDGVQDNAAPVYDVEKYA